MSSEEVDTSQPPPGLTMQESTEELPPVSETEEEDVGESSMSEMSQSEDDKNGVRSFFGKARKKLDGFAQAFAASWRRGESESEADDDDLPAEMAVDKDDVKDKEHRLADHHARLKRRASVTAQHFLEYAPRAKISRAVSAPVWLVGNEDLQVARTKALTEKEAEKNKLMKRSNSSPSLLLSQLHIRFKQHLPDMRKPSLNVPGFTNSAPVIQPKAGTTGRARGFGKATSSPSISRAMYMQRMNATRGAAGLSSSRGSDGRQRAVSSINPPTRTRGPISRTISSPAALSPLSRIEVVSEAKQRRDPNWLKQVRERRDSDIQPVEIATHNLIGALEDDIPSPDGQQEQEQPQMSERRATTSKRRLGFAKTLSTPTIDRLSLDSSGGGSRPPLAPPPRATSPQLPPGLAGASAPIPIPVNRNLPNTAAPGNTPSPGTSPAERARVRGVPKRNSLEETRIARAVSSPLPVVSEWMERLFAGQLGRSSGASGAGAAQADKPAGAANNMAISPGTTPPTSTAPIAQSPLRMSSSSESDAISTTDDESERGATTSAPVPDSAPTARQDRPEPPEPRSPSRFLSGELAELSSPEISSIEGSPGYRARVAPRQQQQQHQQQDGVYSQAKSGAEVFQLPPELMRPAEIEWELDPTTGTLTQAEQFESRKMAVLYCVFTAGILESHVTGPCDSLSLYQWISDMQVALELPCSVILLSLIYVERLHSRQSHLEFSESALRGLFLMAMLTGSKYAEDETYPNRAWSNLTNGQFDISMFNDMEHEFLFLLGWSVHVTEEEYEYYRSFAIRGDDGAQEWKEALVAYEEASGDHYAMGEIDTSVPPPPGDFGHPHVGDKDDIVMRPPPGLPAELAGAPEP